MFVTTLTMLTDPVRARNYLVQNRTWHSRFFFGDHASFTGLYEPISAESIISVFGIFNVVHSNYQKTPVFFMCFGASIMKALINMKATVLKKAEFLTILQKGVSSRNRNDSAILCIQYKL